MVDGKYDTKVGTDYGTRKNSKRLSILYFQSRTKDLGGQAENFNFTLKDFARSGGSFPSLTTYGGDPPLDSDFLKHYFGFGDGFTSGTVQFRNSTGLRKSFAINTGGADATEKVHHAIGSICRGWKYGIMNALPHFSNAVFRRDHFGYPRDMLEQRLDGKILDLKGLLADGTDTGKTSIINSPVQIKFLSGSKFIKPDKALLSSSNLSIEATSSLPYFDDISRN